MEKEGGYAGQQKSSGLIMWLLAQIADQLLAGDVAGAQEMLALGMVAIEQSSLDQGQLALQEEPLPQIFTNSSSRAINPRLRAFGPLCPPDWGATALAYVKELDLLNVRRQEAIGRQVHPGDKTRRKATTRAKVSEEAKLWMTTSGMSSGSRGVRRKSLGSGNANSSCKAEESVRGPLPSWKSLQTFSFCKCTSTLCRQVLDSRTPFAEFLKTNFHVLRSSSVAPETALFPWPVPKIGVFEGNHRAGSRERRKRAFDQMFHIVVMALNFWHADFKFPSLPLVCRVPSPGHVLCRSCKGLSGLLVAVRESFPYHPVAEDALR